MLEHLKEEVCAANLALVKAGLVILTWGNVSAITEDGRYVVIKPSGVDYATMTPEQMVVTDPDGNIMEGDLRPSSDLPTHLELYKAFPGLRSVVHTHSTYATALSQAGQDLPCYGTTHADTFYGPVPCTPPLTEDEVRQAYEKNTGRVIAECFAARNIDPAACPGVLVASHGPFTWGTSCRKAVEHAVILEEVARMALLTRQYRPDAAPAPQYLQDKHYFRKHGENAYYGQK